MTDRLTDAEIEARVDRIEIELERWPPDSQAFSVTVEDAMWLIGHVNRLRAIELAARDVRQQFDGGEWNAGTMDRFRAALDSPPR